MELFCVIEIHFCVKYFKLLKITLQLIVGPIQFSIVLSIVFQPVFSVFPPIYRTLNCHSHSTNTKGNNLLMFLLCIKRIFIDWLTDWLTRNDSWMYFVFQLLSLKVFSILGLLSKIIDKSIQLKYILKMCFVIRNWNTFWKYFIQHW